MRSFYRSTDEQPPTSPTAPPVVTEPSILGQTGISLNTFRKRMQFSRKSPSGIFKLYGFLIQKIKFYTYIYHKIHNRSIFMLKLNL